jgi:hypothetical protein
VALPLKWQKDALIKWAVGGHDAAANMRRNSTPLDHLHCFQSASGGPFMKIHAISGIFACSVARRNFLRASFCLPIGPVYATPAGPPPKPPPLLPSQGGDRARCRFCGRPRIWPTVFIAAMAGRFRFMKPSKDHRMYRSCQYPDRGRTPGRKTPINCLMQGTANARKLPAGADER